MNNEPKPCSKCWTFHGIDDCPMEGEENET